MDFIVKFQRSEDIIIEQKYNDILIIMNKISKYMYLILYNKGFLVKQIIWILLD